MNHFGFPIQNVFHFNQPCLKLLVGELVMGDIDNWYQNVWQIDNVDFYLNFWDEELFTYGLLSSSLL